MVSLLLIIFAIKTLYFVQVTANTKIFLDSGLLFVRSIVNLRDLFCYGMVANAVQMTDEELVGAINNNIGVSSRYFELLYRRYFDKVLDKCYSFVKNRLVAEELTEDIFSKVFEKLPLFRSKSSFSSWLYAITYNHCIDYLREKKKLHYPEWNNENALPEIINETDDIVEEINYENLLVIMEMIHPEEKALLFMKYKDELSMKQIGEALRISEDAAKMRIKRARARVLYLYTQKFLKEK